MRAIMLMLAIIFLFICSCAAKDGAEFSNKSGAMDIGKVEDVKIYTLQKQVHFEKLSSKIPESFRSVLEQNANWMRDNPSKIIVLEGHCDQRGTEEYNLILGDKRARAVKAALIELGVDDDSLIVVSYGEGRLLDDAYNEDAWRKNRRVQFTIR